jgi:hypothetical protein
VLQLEVLIGELSTIDGLATTAVAPGEVTTLAHEAGDDPVEAAALVVEGLARGTSALLACGTRCTVRRGGSSASNWPIGKEGPQRLLLTSAESAEVLGGLGGHVSEEL